MLKKALIGASTTVAAVVMAATPALAHFCSNANWNERAQERVVKSTNWFTFETAVSEFLCPAGATYFLANAAQAGIPLDRPIHGNAIMGAGALFNKGKVPPGHVYLTEAHGEALDTIFNAALAICEG